MSKHGSEQALEVALTDLVGTDAIRVIRGIATIEEQTLAEFIIRCVKQEIELYYVEGFRMQEIYEDIFNKTSDGKQEQTA